MMKPPFDKSALAHVTQDAANMASDIADNITTQSINFAKETFAEEPIRSQESNESRLLELTAIHADITAKVYAVHELTSAIREMAPEIAGAISEAGTDIGAGTAEALVKAYKRKTCQRAT